MEYMRDIKLVEFKAKVIILEPIKLTNLIVLLQCKNI